MVVTPGEQQTKWHECLLAAGCEKKPGLTMLDSGCFRSLAGKPTHSSMQEYLKQFGLQPLWVPKVEEFVFGNCNTEFSDKSFMYPVFRDGKLIDVVDLARIKPECPPLISKGVMKDWDVKLNFGEQVTEVQKHGFETPFIKDSPFVDLFDMGEKF